MITKTLLNKILNKTVKRNELNALSVSKEDRDKIYNNILNGGGSGSGVTINVTDLFEIYFGMKSKTYYDDNNVACASYCVEDSNGDYINLNASFGNGTLFDYNKKYYPIYLIDYGYDMDSPIIYTEYGLKYGVGVSDSSATNRTCVCLIAKSLGAVGSDNSGIEDILDINAALEEAGAVKADLNEKSIKLLNHMISNSDEYMHRIIEQAA
jgi:hypothetical protein